MIRNLLLLFYLINADSAQIYQNCFKIKIDQHQMDIINENLSESWLAVLFRDDLKSLYINKEDDTYEIIFQFHE
jgi:hypothetical protein